ncbi:MAG: AarF/ABC1/UbiB kinase family protein [Pseudomonadota bacterium]
MTDQRPLSVPASRVARMARLGGLASGIARDMALDGARRLAAGERPDLRTLALTPANATRFADQLARMRGAAMKVGQLLSMDAGELMPPELADVLARLRAEAHFMPPKQLKSVLNAAWGPDWLKQFKRFDVRPIAAASIGQVHRAVTRDGRDLAVKVQYPGVRRSIDSDVTNVAALIRMTGIIPKEIDLAPLLEEAKRQLHDEADYLREGRYLSDFHSLLSGRSEFVVPALHADLTTEDILVMDFVESTAVETLEEASQTARDAAMSSLIKLIFQEIFQFNLIQSDPNFANYRYDPDGQRIVLLDFGATRQVDPVRAGQFRAFFEAGLKGQRESVSAAMQDIGFFDETAASHHVDALVDMAEMALEPIRMGGVFDFAETDLAARLRDAGLAFGEARDFWHIPPADVLLIQRKLAGMYLLGARLKARVNLDDILSEHL